MSSPGRVAPPQGVPTLTEVIDLGRHVDVPAPKRPMVEAMLSEPPAEEQASDGVTGRTLSNPLAQAAITASSELEAQFVERVYADVQRQIDLMLEYRMREVLAPVLARVSDSLIADARNELASTLREVVSRAVALELSRHRGR